MECDAGVIVTDFTGAVQAANRSENPNVAVAKAMQKAASKYHSIWKEWTDDASEESSEGSACKRARVSEEA